jgi:hypothetical protein
LLPLAADEIESEKGIKLICIMGYNGRRMGTCFRYDVKVFQVILFAESIIKTAYVNERYEI